MWKVKKTERILDSEYVKVDKDDVILPKGREINDLEFPPISYNYSS